MSENENICPVCGNPIEDWNKDKDLCEACQANLRAELRKYNGTKTGRNIIRNWIKGFLDEI